MFVGRTCVGEPGCSMRSRSPQDPRCGLRVHPKPYTIHLNPENPKPYTINPQTIGSLVGDAGHAEGRHGRHGSSQLTHGPGEQGFRERVKGLGFRVQGLGLGGQGFGFGIVAMNYCCRFHYTICTQVHPEPYTQVCSHKRPGTVPFTTPGFRASLSLKYTSVRQRGF